MRDSQNDRFDKRKVEALPDVSEQLDRMEAVVENLQSSIARWMPHLLFCAGIMAVSAAASAVALVTVAFLVYFGG